MLFRSVSARHAARLSAAIRRPVRALLEPLESRRLLSAGLLDPAFGSSGVVIDNSIAAGGVAVGGGVVVQSSGKIVTIGSDASGHAVLERFNANGTLDTTFGSGGKVTSVFENGTSSLALAAGDKLVIGGGDNIARYNADGSIDTTFGAGAGYITVSNLGNLVNSVAVQADGKIVASGTNHGVPDVANVQRVNADGSVDNTFGVNGAVNFSAAGVSYEINGVVVESNGKIAVAGETFDANTVSNFQTLLVELNTNGSIDGTHFTALPGEFASLAEMKGGGLVAVGQDDNATGLIAGYAVTGAKPGQTVFVDHVHDGIAGGSGVIAPKFDSVAVQADGKIVAAGSSNPIYRGIYAVRTDAAGNIDRTFGDYGATYLNPSNDIYTVEGIAFEPNGAVRLVADGFQPGGMSFPASNDLELIGFQPDGTPPGDQMAPATPGNVELIPILTSPDYGAETIHFTESSTDATGFAIERADTLGGPYTLVTDIPAQGGAVNYTYTDTSVESTTNTQYSYRVLAFNYSYASLYTTPAGIVTPYSANATNPGGAPNGPYGLVAETIAPGNIGLAFYDSSTNETGFVVERSTSASGPYTALQATPLAAVNGTGSKITFRDSTASVGQTYYYRVYAINGSYQSSIDGTIAVTIPSVGEAPFGGVAVSLPATIQAENYDTGGEGVAYHDTDPANLGGQYRNDGVDIEAITAGGYAVDYTHAGESLNYTLTNPTLGLYTMTARVADVGTGASFQVLDNGIPITIMGPITIPNTGSFQNYVNVNVGTFDLPAGVNKITISFYSNTQYGFAGNLDSFTFAPASGGETPYNGTPFNAGQQIEAENFDNGGEGVAYHDTEAANLGGQYRTTEGVDIESTTDAGGGYDVGWTHTGEYLSYTGYFPKTDLYGLTFRVANAAAGGAFHINIDGKNVTGTISIPNTGGFQNWTNIGFLNIPITAGTHVVQIVFDAQSAQGFSGNVNWLKFTENPNPEQPFNGTPAPLPGTIQAENFDTGGEGVAYHDTTTANEGGQYRTSEGVDIESIGGGNYAVDYTHAGEYMNYTVNIATTGDYTFSALVSNFGAGGQFHIEEDRVSITNSLLVPDTRSFTTYTTVSAPLIHLTAGQHVIRWVWDDNSQYGYAGNLDSFSFT